MQNRGLFLFVLLVVFSCNQVVNKKEEPQSEPEYTYSIGSGNIQKEEFKELDTSVWILKSYQLTPTDTLPFHSVTENDDFVFNISKNRILKDQKQVGEIRTAKQKVDESVVGPDGEKIDDFYSSVFTFDQPEDKVVNGSFSIAYFKLNRLHLQHKRINNKTGKEEKIRLIFYKKGKP